MNPTQTTPQRQAADPERIRKALRATEGMPEPEQAIAAAKQALADAVFTLERLPDRPDVPRSLAILQCKDALTLLGQNPE